jgi:endonuclease YncB( thermonuclease family)
MIKKLMLNLMLIIASLALLHGSAQAWTHSNSGTHRTSKRAAPVAFSAVVTHVTDGDTIWVSAGGGQPAIDVRLQGIDAPEICQDYGRVAAGALLQHLQHKTVSVTGRARDKYGRVIAKVSLNGEDIGAWLVENGHAWSYHSSRSLGTYRVQETSARQAGRGLWGSGSPMEPKVFRKRTKCHK